MPKILKNQTASPIVMKDTGVTLAASPTTYTIPPQDYLIWAASSDIITQIGSGAVIVNDGTNDLSIVRGTKLITDVLATGVYFADNTNNGFTATDDLRINNITQTSLSPRMTRTLNVTNGTLTLTKDSTFEQVAYGSATGFKYKLPDATTLTKGWKYEIFNRSAVPVSIIYSDSSTLYQIASQGYARATLEDNSSNTGIWIVEASNLADIDLSNPDFTGVKDGFEDFMFDAYAGNGGNDNQYAFTAIANNGSSNIDGAVSVVGNDYEGIHILDSLTSATARPLVSAFNRVNRIKLGAQSESYEIRARIETLADVNQKFTTRYGLMDVDTIGLPANGIIFSYDPIYPVTPVAQVVTATPTITTSNYQVWTQIVNGVSYAHILSTLQIVNVTPNSFPNATYQVISVTWSRANNTLYTVTINGTTCSYTSDGSATDAEIALGLGTAINNAVGSVVTATTSGKPITVTSDILGQAFTYSSSANVTITLTTANVPKKIYTETIAGVPYSFTSDGTPTAAEVVAGLTALINADSGCPATASGTTVLILTGKVSGAQWTYSGTTNLTQTLASLQTNATDVVTGLKNLINADSGCAVTATGTTTLIMTAKVAGVAFTYADGDANLTQVLTVANVAEVLYSGNWICSIIRNSTITSVNSGIPVVPGQWYRLKVVIRADGQGAYFYIDSLFIDEVVTAVPSVALRYIFKLEKTLGTTSRTTSIDYITWRRTRG